jgi:hypothetical protein
LDPNNPRVWCVLALFNILRSRDLRLTSAGGRGNSLGTASSADLEFRQAMSIVSRQSSGQAKLQRLLHRFATATQQHDLLAMAGDVAGRSGHGDHSHDLIQAQ